MSGDRLRRARDAAAAVPDPELPGVTVGDLGMLRGVRDEAGTVVVTLTPTYSGCPATAAILAGCDRALAGAGIGSYRIETRLAPPWSSRWITAEGRAKLRAAGIAVAPAACPRCGSTTTTLVSAYGATPCRALRRCENCREPFDAVKAI